MKHLDMQEPLPVVADVPTATPGLGFAEYVEAIGDAVRGGRPAQFTIGIYGPWGSGKSSILHALREQLQKSPEVIPVYFDAWRYEQAEHIIVPLLHKTYITLQEAGKHDVARQLLRALQAIVAGLNFKLFNVRDAKQEWDAQQPTPLDEGFSQPFEELRQIADRLGDLRIAVLIDDLDRCSDRNVVAVLEAINLIMDVRGMIFVLALDYDVLVKAIERRYEHVSGHAFIEKLVQIPFRVPPLTISNRIALKDLLPEWDRHTSDLPDYFADRVIDIAREGLRGNPRQIKRLINSFLVIHRIMQRRRVNVDPMLLIAIIGMQLRWPDDHQRLTDAVREARGNRDADPLAVLHEHPSDGGLEKYATQFITSGVNTDTLWRMLQLTSVVSPEAEPEGDPFALPASD